jgi:hypothetical protein
MHPLFVLTSCRSPESEMPVQPERVAERHADEGDPSPTRRRAVDENVAA